MRIYHNCYWKWMWRLFQKRQKRLESRCWRSRTPKRIYLILFFLIDSTFGLFLCSRGRLLIQRRNVLIRLHNWGRVERLTRRIRIWAWVEKLIVLLALIWVKRSRRVLFYFINEFISIGIRTEGSFWHCFGEGVLIWSRNVFLEPFHRHFLACLIFRTFT